MVEPVPLEVNFAKAAKGDPSFNASFFDRDAFEALICKSVTASLCNSLLLVRVFFRKHLTAENEGAERGGGASGSRRG